MEVHVKKKENKVKDFVKNYKKEITYFLLGGTITLSIWTYLFKLLYNKIDYSEPEIINNENKFTICIKHYDKNVLYGTNNIETALNFLKKAEEVYKEIYG